MCALHIIVCAATLAVKGSALLIQQPTTITGMRDMNWKADACSSARCTLLACCHHGQQPSVGACMPQLPEHTIDLCSGAHGGLMTRVSSAAMSEYGAHVECATASRMASTVSRACGGQSPRKACDCTALVLTQRRPAPAGRNALLCGFLPVETVFLI